MSKQAAEGSNSNSGIVVGGKRRSKTALRIKLVALGVVIVLIAGLTILITTILTKKTVDTTANNKDSASQQNLTLEQQASKLAYEGKYTEAQQLLDTKVKASNDKSTQQEIYRQQATVAFNARNYKDALGYAQKAEAVKPVAGTADLLGQIAAAMGDKPAAQRYFQKAIDRLDPNAENYASAYRTYQKELQAVK